VVVAQKHNEVGDVFNFISSIINIVGVSCKRIEEIRENGEISSG
jgi:predicted house-cleaning noncanonical NTP pyrophosphatase (MazG superfamily)